MKVGLVTLHDHNYGSALQCYATRTYLKGKGYDSDVICEVGEYSLLKRYYNRVLELGMLCLSYIRDAKDIIKVFKSQRRGALRNSTKTENSISRFNQLHLSCKYYSRKGLEEIAKSDKYQFFLSGSDQVWNGRQIDNYYQHFLRFAPKEKRVAWAPSFGGSTIAKYNKKRYSTYIKDYKLLSVRERSGIDIIKQLTGREDVAFLSDPVMLLSANEWRNCYSNNVTTEKPEGKFVLAFFLDKASELAIGAIKKLKGESKLPVFTVGYPHDEFPSQHIDGSPWDFLAMIDGAECVLTDSFHATVFSIIFHKKFYTFERQYVHGHSQSTRITELLNDCHLQSCFSPVVLKDEIFDFSTADVYFDNVKSQFSNYWDNLSVKVEPGIAAKSVRNNESDCCGCGACADICPVSAITMSNDDSGNRYPIIKEESCINCGACTRVCGFHGLVSTGTNLESGYVAVGMDTELLKKSASGGIFATMAKSIITEGGVVYGASLWLENGKVQCEHVPVESIDDLHKIQGSKYVQSSTDGIFSAVRSQLKTGRNVLFGGTSCQVASLKKFLGKDYENLLTVDLVCHGVPNIQVLQEYLDYKSSQIGEEIIDFTFRVREGKNKPYVLTITSKDKAGKIHKHYESLRDSSFYRLFMARGCYRPSCYNCPFASISKPADITLGDFYPSDKDISIKQQFSTIELLSTVITHNKKGNTVISCLENHGLQLVSHSTDDLINRHEQLIIPSLPTRDGVILETLRKEKGFKGIQNVIYKRNIELFIPSVVKSISRILRTKQPNKNI